MFVRVITYFRSLLEFEEKGKIIIKTIPFFGNSKLHYELLRIKVIRVDHKAKGEKSHFLEELTFLVK